ncbi:MAG: DUF1800 family protein, partial [Planctomycetota bacterium]
FRKNRYQHDSGEKQILGQTGRYDGDDGVRIVIEHPATPLFVARKLYRFFVSDEPKPRDALLQPLADLFRKSNLQIAPVIERILCSNLFFSDHAYARKIKSPVELVMGMLRSLDATTNTQLVAGGLRTIGQGLFFPPNVKGWDGGRAWINSSTLLGRSNLIADILRNNVTRFDGKTLAEYLRTRDVRTTDNAIEYFSHCLFAISPDDATRDRLRQAADSDSSDDDRRMRSLLHAMMTLPLCQIG